MNIMTNQESIEMSPLGKSLKEARLVANLSIEESAEQLNLSCSIIREIEDELDEVIASNKYAAIYLRGYLANFAKLVGLEAVAEFSEYQQLIHPERKTISLQTKAMIPPKAKKKPKWMVLVLSVILFVIVYLLADQLGWLTKSADNNHALAQITAQTATENSDVEHQINALHKQNAAEQVDVMENTAVQQIADNHALENAAVSDESRLNSASLAAPKDIVKVDDKMSEPVVLAAKAQHLALRFKDDCWTEVFDATGKRLAYGLYKKGRKLALKGKAPFKLMLGAPNVVDIQYQHKTLTKQFAAGKPARFTLPQ